MENFNFYLPTRIYFGKDSHLNIGEIAKEHNFNNVLVVCGNHAKKDGLLDIVLSKLDEAGVKHHEYIGVTANPEVRYVNEALAIAKENNIDGVIGVGGGSVIDVSKSVAHNYYYDGDTYDFNLLTAVSKKALPVGVVVTIAAAGSEMSTSCVISNTKLGKKGGFNSELNRPLFAVLNPELTFTVSKYQTACGISDIISHSFERYFNPSKEIEFSDSFALALIKDTVKFGEVAVNEPTNYDARAAIMMDGAYSHNGFTSLGKSAPFVIHKMEHVLSAFDEKIAHGAGLAVLMPAWMNYVYSYDIPKFARFAREVFNINYEDDTESAIMGIRSFKDFLKEIGMPVTLTELGIKKENIPLLADMMTENGTRLIGPKSIRPLNKEDIITILNSCL